MQEKYLTLWQILQWKFHAGDDDLTLRMDFNYLLLMKNRTVFCPKTSAVDLMVKKLRFPQSRMGWLTQNICLSLELWYCSALVWVLSKFIDQVCYNWSCKKAQHSFPKWGGGSEAVWKFSENSSNLVQVVTPYQRTYMGRCWDTCVSKKKTTAGQVDTNSRLAKMRDQEKLMNQKTLMSVSKNWIFWNICAFLLLLATRSSNRFSE